MLVKTHKLPLLMTTLMLLVTSSYADVNNLKGTFNILKDEYKDLSLLNGAIAAHTNYLMHLYDDGTFGKEGEVTGPEDTKIKVPDVSNASEIVKMIHAFFYRVPGTTTRGDFVLTDAIKSASPEDKESIVKAIAWVMAQVKNMYIDTTKTGKEKRQGTELKRQLDGKLNKVSMAKILISEDLPNLRILATLARGSSVMNQDNSRLRLFKLAWTGYVNEHKKQAIFPPHSMFTVLQGIVYSIAGDDKRLMYKFYEKLNEILGTETETIFVGNGQIQDSWLHEKFDQRQLGSIAAPLTFTIDNRELLNQYYENIVYLSLLPGAYPQEAGYTTALYKYDEHDISKQVPFTDCMETTLRNIINILLYDKDQMIFNLHKLQGIQPIAQLEKFYTDHKNASDTESSDLHNQWTNIVENIPFVIYMEKVDKEGRIWRSGRKKIGYVKVPEGITTNIEDIYEQVDQDDILFEVKANLRNIILIFNHIFGLNLFEEEQGSTSQEKTAHALERTDFIKTYFPRMCSKLGIEFFGFFEDSQPVDDIDREDNGPIIVSKLQIRAEAPDIDAEIRTYSGHGEIKIIDNIQGPNPIIEWLKSNHALIIKSSGSLFDSFLFNMVYLALYKNYATEKQSQIIQDYLQGLDAQHRLNAIFFLPIDNSDFVYTLVDVFQAVELDNWLYLLIDMLCSKIPDLNRRQAALLNVYAAVVKHNLKGEKLPDLVRLAIENVRSDNFRIRKSAINLFQALFEKGQGFNEAIKVATEKVFFREEYYFLTEFTIDLFKALLEKNQGIQEVFNLAIKNVDSQDMYIRRVAIDLLTVLVKTAHAYPEAIKITAKNIRSENYGVSVSVINLFKALVEKGQAYPEAINAAIEHVWSRDYAERRLGLQLFHAVTDQLMRMPSDEKIIQTAIDLGKKVDAKTEEGKQLIQQAEKLEQWLKEHKT